jgi:hypothetical protein
LDEEIFIRLPVIIIHDLNLDVLTLLSISKLKQLIDTNEILSSYGLIIDRFDLDSIGFAGFILN